MNRRQHLPLTAMLCLALAATAGCGGGEPSRGQAGAAPPPRAADGRPSLAVLIIVDQFRADYLTRFASRFDGGFARLQREGLRFDGALHLHATTQTSPGHASLSTGVPPSRHGIIGNRWYERESRQMVGCVQDAASPAFTGRGAGVSPSRMLAPSLGEWIKNASHYSRVVSISGKETAATLLAGRKADAVFWYDRAAGRFTTSRYYASSEPEILVRFAKDKPVSALACASWERLDGPGDLPEADPDLEPWEPPAFGGFPHRMPCPEGSGPPAMPAVKAQGLESEVRLTPYLDDLTLDLAEDAIVEYELGKDGAPDLLAISLSATDYIGHRYGPDSQEILDQLRRLDRRLGRFLERIDRDVGLDHALIVLTGDHGTTSCPERDPSHRLERVQTPELERRLEKAMTSRLGRGPWVAGIEADQVYLVDDSARSASAALEELAQEPSMAHVYTREELAGEAQSPADEYLPLMRASWTRQRGGDMMVRLKQGWFLSESPTGSEHGSPYPDDMRVPLIFRGPGITPGARAERVAVYRAAPTIASLLGQAWPSDLPEGPLPMSPGSPMSPGAP